VGGGGRRLRKSAWRVLEEVLIFCMAKDRNSRPSVLGIGVGKEVRFSCFLPVRASFGKSDWRSPRRTKVEDSPTQNLNCPSDQKRRESIRRSRANEGISSCCRTRSRHIDTSRVVDRGKPINSWRIITVAPLTVRCPENSTGKEVTLSEGIDGEEEFIDLALPRVPEETEEGKEQDELIVSEEGKEEIKEEDSAEFSLKVPAKLIEESSKVRLVEDFVTKGVAGLAVDKPK
jgi:hypothetical protein